MQHEKKSDDEQTQLWNGVAGHAWVDAQAVLDGMFAPIERLLVEAAVAESAQHVLDVGCGTGATTLALARRLGAQARCVGIDLSAPMLAAARARAAREGSPATFVEGDAQRHAFEPAGFDMIVSRFGVMFFDDAVAAFAHLRRAARANAALRAVVWRAAAENPFMTTAERAAAPLLPDMPARDPDAPGQFAFADRERVRRILADAGWTDIDIRALDVDCRFPQAELSRYVSRLGPLGRILPDADEATRTRVLDAVLPTFDGYVRDGDVRFTAACWSIGARTPAG